MLELAVDAVVMYLVMYTMIWSVSDFYPNLNNGYMTAMMVAAMAVVMALTMKSMFPSPRARVGFAAAAAVVGIVGFAGMRTQVAVGDKSFLRSMIPHHSRAILVCQESSITDPEIRTLCDGIVKSQTEEIRQMKEILERY